MPNPYFQFKRFTVHHDRCAMKVTTDSCLFGSWCAEEIRKGNKSNNTLLDIGTGTGLLSLMIAQKNNCLIDAVEIDTATAEQAKENINASPFKEKISVYNQDILKFEEQLYNSIISNPPFYEKEIESPNEKRNEAHHGTSLKFSDLVLYINQQLVPGGNFYLLLPFKRIKEMEKVLMEMGLYIEKKIVVAPSTLHPPFRVMIKGTNTTASFEENFLSITNEQGTYTKEFVKLLQDYYLYL